MLPSQMMKGILDNCILIVIAQEDTYGYDISQKLKSYGFSDISEGTIYPLLLRLEKNGCINSEFRKSAYGPNRKILYHYKSRSSGNTGFYEALEGIAAGCCRCDGRICI